MTITSVIARIQNSPDARGVTILTIFTLFSRALQALVPFVVVYKFGAGAQADFYFYWVTQANLLATFLASVWPALVIPSVVQARNTSGFETASALARFRFFSFFPITLCIAAIMSCGALLGAWGGPQGSTALYYLIFGLAIVGLWGSLVLNEISAAFRKFGVFNIAQMLAIIAQLATLWFIEDPTQLLYTFALYVLIQTVVCAVMLRQVLTCRAVSTFPALPKANVLLVYGGSIFTMLVGHVTYRLLATYGEGAISAFALAQMITGVPQLLFINQLSNVAAVSLAEKSTESEEAFMQSAQKWKKLLVRTSVLAALFLVALTVVFCVRYDSLQVTFSPLLAPIVLLLCIPLGVSGLNTWVARTLMAQNYVRVGVTIQIGFQVCTLLLLIAAHTLIASELAIVSVFAVIALLYFFVIEDILGLLKLRASSRYTK